MSSLHLSKEESEEFGLKIARSNNLLQFDFKKIAEEINKDQYDLLRIKVSMSNPTLFNDIAQLGIPYNIFSFLIRKSTTAIGTIDYRVPELSFIKYNSSLKSDFCKALEDVISNASGVTYSNNLYNQLISKSKMTLASIAYYINLAEHDEKSHFYLGFFKNTCVGFCSFRLENKIAEGIYFGVTSEFRNLGLAHEFLMHAKEKCFELGADEFYTDTIIQNPNSLYPQMNIGLAPKQTYINMVFFPLLSKKPAYETSFTLNNYFDTFSCLQSWMDKLNLHLTTFDEITTCSIDTVSYPVVAVFKLHIIETHTMIVCVSIKNKLNWSYFINKEV